MSILICISLNYEVTYLFYKSLWWTSIFPYCPESFQIPIAKFRTSNHRLPIQRGRYEGIAREERLCRLCNEQEPGNEYHFILECKNPRLAELRSKHFAPYYRYSPSLDKLKDLFCNRGRKLFKLARFLKEASNLI